MATNKQLIKPNTITYSYDKEDEELRILSTTQKSIDDIMNTIHNNNPYDVVDFMRLFFLIPREEFIPFIDGNNTIIFQEKMNLAFKRFHKILSKEWGTKIRTQKNNPKRIMSSGSTYEDVSDGLEILQMTIFSQKTGKIIDNIPRASKFKLEKSYQISETMKYIRDNWPMFVDSLIEVTDPYHKEEEDSFHTNATPSDS